MNAKWLVFMFGGKTFIGTLAGNKLFVDKMENKTPSDVSRALVSHTFVFVDIRELRCYVTWLVIPARAVAFVEGSRGHTYILFGHGS